jgi:hypothetical protein
VYKNKIQKRKQLTFLSDDEKIAWCHRWRESTLSMVEFCKIHPVAKSSLYGWNRRFFSSNDVKEAPAFIPVLPTAKVQNEQDAVSIELTLANGATPARLNVSLAAAVHLLQELNHAVAIIR